MSLWYYTTCNSKDEALDFLKVVFKNGIDDDDMGETWLTMNELK